MQQYFPGYPQPFGGMFRHQYQQPQQAQESIIRVTGLEGAKSYPMAPDSRVALFDDSRDVFYVKTTDAGGYPTLAAYTFSPLREAPAPAPDYVTRDEFNQLKEMIESAKQPVRKSKQPDAE